MDESYLPALSGDEIATLGEQFDIRVYDGERDELESSLQNWLSDIDDLYAFPVDSTASSGDRTWWEPTDDPHRAIATWCAVEPTADHGDLLAGVTVGLKDNILVSGVPMTCGSQAMKGFVPNADATVVERLREAGATIAAKTNLSEFAAVLLSANKGPVTNPHDTERIAGPTSSGSAVAVATELVDVALGTDTGGSVRIPASFCGVVGHKPTYGLVPLDGVVENTYTQDHVGQFARTVADTARVLEALAGPADCDPASLQAAGREEYRLGDYVGTVDSPPAPETLTIGVLEEGFGEGVADRVEETVETALDAVEAAGATVEPVSIPSFEYARPIKKVLSLTELAAHWRAGGAPYRRGGVVEESYQVSFANRTRAASGELQVPYKSKLLAGAHLISNHGGRHYTRAQAAREVLADDVDDALTSVDVLAFPTTPTVAPAVDDVREFETLEFDLARNTRLADVTRHPALSLPAGTVEDLPVGLQLLGPQFHDETVFGVAAAVESIV